MPSRRVPPKRNPIVFPKRTYLHTASPAIRGKRIELFEQSVGDLIEFVESGRAKKLKAILRKDPLEVRITALLDSLESIAELLPMDSVQRTIISLVEKKLVARDFKALKDLVSRKTCGLKVLPKPE